MSPNASGNDGAVVRRSVVRKRPQAIRDLCDIAVYLAEESGNEELAYRFLDTAETAFRQLAAMPEMGAARTAMVLNGKRTG